MDDKMLASENVEDRYEVIVKSPNGTDWAKFYVRDSTDPNLGERLFDAILQLESIP